jgi:RNA polymerase sigma-70 factor (ECF subfamily)
MEQEEIQHINNALKRILFKDTYGIDIIYNTIGGRMLSVAVGIVKNRQIGEDVVQESFIKIIEKIDNFTPNSNGYAWICKIVQNTALNKLKSEKIRITEDIDEFHNLTNNENSEEISQNNIMAKKAMESLDDKQRKMIYYKYYMDMSIREISKKMNISKSTVHKEIKTAEEKMKKYIT